MQQRVVGRIKEVDALDGLVLDLARLGEPVERTNAGGEVVESRQMLQRREMRGHRDQASIDFWPGK
jgi:hypothetical protein